MISPSDDAYHELCAYTLTHDSRRFIHQHVIDAYGAQGADDESKPVRLMFSLAGLYLHLEKGFTGRQVQLAHMELARRSRIWPTFALPTNRGAMTAADVLAASPGADRDAAIDAWCASVWDAYADSRPLVIEVLQRYGIV
jgi:hypothetical protein